MVGYCVGGARCKGVKAVWGVMGEFNYMVVA